MGEQEKKTVLLDERYYPLAVEWIERGGYVRGPDNSWVKSPDREVCLFLPESKWQRPVRLVNMSPGTALKLLAWLEQERETLERLVETQEKGT